MNSASADEAIARLHELIENGDGSHRPVLIKGQNGNAVLMPEGYWNAVSETLHLLALPGMRRSIHAGMNEKLDACSTTLEW